MSDENLQKKDVRRQRNFDWVWEVLLLVTVAPAIVYGIGSLNYLPVV